MLVRESISFERKKDPKETLGLDYTVKLKEKLYEFFSDIFPYKLDVKIIKEDKKILIWFDASGRIERSIIEDMLDTFYKKFISLSLYQERDVSKIDELLSELGLKTKGKYLFYSSLNPFRNTYNFHKWEKGFIAEYKYEKI